MISIESTIIIRWWECSVSSLFPFPSSYFMHTLTHHIYLPFLNWFSPIFLSFSSPSFSLLLYFLFFLGTFHPPSSPIASSPISVLITNYFHFTRFYLIPSSPSQILNRSLSKKNIFIFLGFFDASFSCYWLLFIYLFFMRFLRANWKPYLASFLIQWGFWAMNMPFYY
mgnify:CR=1 FL=1